MSFRPAIKALALGLLLLPGCEAAAGARAKDAGALSVSEPAACSSDAECVVDLRPAGHCCPGCEPRATTVREQRELDLRCAAVRCASPACVPTRTVPVALCVQGRCTLRQESNQ